MRRREYYSMLGISTTASESEISTAYICHALGCHPDKIPYSDSDEVRNDKIKRFRALCTATSVMLDPERRAAYDQLRNLPQPPQDIEPSMSISLKDAYRVWATAVLSVSFKHSKCDNDTLLKLVVCLGIPTLMIAMGGAEQGGRLCMTFALFLARESLVDELSHMSDDDLRIFMQAIMVLAERGIN